VGTAPTAIPDDLKDDLTPKELRDLVEFLAGEHRMVMRKRFAELAQTVDELRPWMTLDVLDEETVDKVFKATTSLAHGLSPTLDKSNVENFIGALSGISISLAQTLPPDIAVRIANDLARTVAELRRSAKQKQANDGTATITATAANEDPVSARSAANDGTATATATPAA
jgi:hypothetical protein